MAQIILKNVDIHYPVYGDSHPLFRRALVNMVTAGRIYRDERKVSVVKAIDNLSMTLKTGDRLGLVGTNGAGKSTLLKTLGQLYQPTHGELIVDGKVSALFDVCMGMEPERTGYHNIFYMGALLGIPKAKIKSYIPDIEAFSELGEFLRMPVRTYSAGMKLRLGFALCTCIDPTILLLDEAIGAGDKHFIEKAANRAKALYERAEILVIASHSADVIKDFCNKALWLHHGKMVMLGDVNEVLDAYENQPQLANEAASQSASLKSVEQSQDQLELLES